MHHSADLGLITRSDSRVAGHLVARHREKVNRATEIVGLVELDLEVERRSALAGSPQLLDARAIVAVEVGAPGEDPRSHRPRA